MNIADVMAGAVELNKKFLHARYEAEEDEKKDDEDKKEEETEKEVSSDELKDKAKGEDPKPQLTALARELDSTCKCPKCGYIGTAKEFAVSITNNTKEDEKEDKDTKDNSLEKVSGEETGSEEPEGEK